MSITLGPNISSLKALSELSKNTSSLSKTFERLSSGIRINQPSDDPAGLSLSVALLSDARIFLQATRNVNEAISISQVVASALGELNSITQRQLELATQAANGSYTSTQRESLNTEANALVDEYNRIISTTTYNGIQLLDLSTRSITIQVGKSSVDTLSLDLNSALGSTSLNQTTIGDGTFKAATTYQVGGANLYHATSGDFNGDGNLDLVTANSTSNYVGILLGNGNGTFKAVATYAIGGNRSVWVSVGDINGDGKADIASADNFSNSISVLLGNGNGSFAAAKTYATAGNSYSVNLNDVSGDGVLDIIAPDGSGNVSILLGNGNGTFKSGSAYANGAAAAYGSTVIDLNGDGKLDVVTASGAPSNAVSVLLGNGNGTFLASKTYATSAEPSDVAVVDLNADGIPDLVSSNFSGNNISVLIGNGNGTFVVARSYSIDAAGANDVILIDLNSDGFIDTVTSDYSSNKVSVIIGNGNGTFKAAKTYSVGGSSPNGLVVGDFNNDMALDLATPDDTNKNISILLGNIDGNLSSVSSTTTSAYVSDVDLLTQQNALSAISTFNSTLERITLQQGITAAQMSRFEVTFRNLEALQENYSAAAARIENIDVAEEFAKMVRLQILQASQLAVLAQANQTEDIVTFLLKF